MVEVWKKDMTTSFEKICRVCLEESTDLLSIYSRYCITTIAIESPSNEGKFYYLNTIYDF